MHGGSAPQALKKAKQNLQDSADQIMQALIDIALDEQQPTRDRVIAMRDLLDRAGFAAPRDLNINAHVEQAPDWEAKRAEAVREQAKARMLMRVATQPLAIEGLSDTEDAEVVEGG